MAGPVVDTDLHDEERNDEELTDDQLTDDQLTDDQLTALALAADPDAPLGDDAVSIWAVAPGNDDGLLPDWYMPAPAAGGRSLRGWRRLVILLVVVTFVLLEAYGLCSTYGKVVLG